MLVALVVLSAAVQGSPGVLRAEREVARPERLHHVSPEYPAALHGALPVVMGIVTLDVELDEEGRPVDIKVLAGKPLLDKAAIDVVREWRYAATLVEGVPRRVVLTETVDVFPSEGLRASHYGKILNDTNAPKPHRFQALQRLEEIGVHRKEVVKALEKASKDADEYIREAVLALLASRGPDGNKK